MTHESHRDVSIPTDSSIDSSHLPTATPIAFSDEVVIEADGAAEYILADETVVFDREACR